MHLKVERNRGLTFITAFRISTQLYHGTRDVDPRMDVDPTIWVLA